MKDIFTEKQAEILKKKSKPKRSHYVGTFYPEIFNNGADYLNNGKCLVGIMRMGEHTFDRSDLKKLECPMCHKVELVPYSIVASMLSGSHTIVAACENCKEKVAFHDSDYYHYVRDMMIGMLKEGFLDKRFCDDVLINDDPK